MPVFLTTQEQWLCSTTLLLPLPGGVCVLSVVVCSVPLFSMW